MPSPPSTDEAIAAITLALKLRLQKALNENISALNGEVWTEKPDKVSDVTGPVINLYLYQATINPFMRNNDLVPEVVVLPGGGATLVQTWRVPLALHYLLSFYGDERNLVPQRLLAIALATLHRYPILSAETVRRMALAAFPTSDPDGAPGVDDVNLTIGDLGLDDCFRLWSIFKAPYALSLGCVAATAIVQSAPEEQPTWLVEEIDLNISQDLRRRSIAVEIVNHATAPLTYVLDKVLSGRWEENRQPKDWPVIEVGGRADWRLYSDTTQDASAEVELNAGGSRNLVFRLLNSASGVISCQVEGDGAIDAEVRRDNPGNRVHAVLTVRLISRHA